MVVLTRNSIEGIAVQALGIFESEADARAWLAVYGLTGPDVLYHVWPVQLNQMSSNRRAIPKYEFAPDPPRRKFLGLF